MKKHRQPFCAAREIRASRFALRRCPAFTLIELMVAMGLLTLIVIALMAVFASTQKAFRAGLTQTDILESGRAAMGLIADDLATLSPSDGYSNNSPVNFSTLVTNYASPPSPLYQPLVGSNPTRTNINVLENFFMLTRQNTTWTGVGYVVSTNLPDGTLYPLYRFSMSTNAMAGLAGQAGLYNAFTSIPLTNTSVWSHVMDGVVDLTVRAYDPNGDWMTNTYNFAGGTTNNNIQFLPPVLGEVGFYMFSNTLPASVEIELGVLEDRALQHAESLSGAAQTNYLANQVNTVHIFRQRVLIRNCDPTAYQ